MAKEYAQQSWRVLGRFREILRAPLANVRASFGRSRPSRNALGPKTEARGSKWELQRGGCQKEASRMPKTQARLYILDIYIYICA